MSQDKLAEYRDERGRWDGDAEIAHLIGSSLVKAAREVGVAPEQVGPLLTAFATHLAVTLEEAWQRPLGPDGTPL